MTDTTVKFQDILDAFEFVSCGQPYEHEAFLCTTTGKIHFHSELADDEEPLADDIDESGKYIPIPHKNDLDLGEPLAIQFAGEAMPEAIGEVQGIFSRPGAYARFKAMLEYRGKLEHWYEYEKRAREQALRRWCKDNGIKSYTPA